MITANELLHIKRKEITALQDKIKLLEKENNMRKKEMCKFLGTLIGDINESLKQHRNKKEQHNEI